MQALAKYRVLDAEQLGKLSLMIGDWSNMDEDTQMYTQRG